MRVVCRETRQQGWNALNESKHAAAPEKGFLGGVGVKRCFRFHVWMVVVGRKLITCFDISLVVVMPSPKQMLNLAAVARRLEVPYARLWGMVKSGALQPDAMAGATHLFSEHSIMRVESALYQLFPQRFAHLAPPRPTTISRRTDNLIMAGALRSSSVRRVLS